MSKEEKPLEYQRRIVDTKGIAQRLQLDYLSKPRPFSYLRRRLMWLAPVAAAIAVAPFLIGVGGGEKAFSNGPVSRAHSIFESNCAACHTKAFSRVPDQACRSCHDGPPHPAKAVDQGKPRGEVPCARCHVEHRGTLLLAEVRDQNCTSCHKDLSRHGDNVRLQARSVTAFRSGRHPEFASRKLPDTRPLKLNHAAHMPARRKTIGAIQLPMKCGDCHATDRNSPGGDLLPVTFERNCRSCHARELEFDIYQVLGAPTPAPHSRDNQAIHAFIVETYRKALDANPMLLQRPLGRGGIPAAGASAWLARVVADSEAFLFERKCRYCHEYDGRKDGYPVVSRVNPVSGRFVPNAPKGEPWLLRGEFHHRAHRAVDCASCHSAARTSTATSDVLIPAMNDCRACHGASGTYLDNCAQCHLYHNKGKERERDRRPKDELFAFRKQSTAPAGAHGSEP